MRAWILLFALVLSLPAWGLTNNGVSAPLTAAGTVATDCPLAMGAATAITNGGTNGKAAALQLPSWASSADIDVSGTFTATWTVAGSTDGTSYRAITGSSTLSRYGVSSSTAVGAATVSDVSMRYVCIVLTSFTSGTAVVTIEPRAGSPLSYLMLATGTPAGGGVASGGTSSGSAQGASSTSSIGLMVVNVADKAVVHQPVAATQASASITTFSGRHIGTSCTVYISTVAAQPDIVVNLRDGATGAGTILWTGRVSCAITSGDQCKAQSPPLNVIGSANTAMTCETATAPAAGNFATATLTYHDAG